MVPHKVGGGGGLSGHGNKDLNTCQVYLASLAVNEKYRYILMLRQLLSFFLNIFR
jgi:hypothetical protein